MEIKLDLIQKINDLDLTQIAARLVRKNRWTQKRVEVAIMEYRKFLYIAILRGAVEPSKDIDEVWHNHILYTEKYAKDCAHIAGRLIHHTPYDLIAVNGAICSEACDACACEDKPGLKDTMPFHILLNEYLPTDSVNDSFKSN
ncbi:glycine-rich domain-containing protein [Mucilaginibacter sp.]|uniref:glycine-rich domain-containing protein n=1 Tax=Mucilaginibacter sp. TaxID=1882438 RepID=UPI003D12698C